MTNGKKVIQTGNQDQIYFTQFRSAHLPVVKTYKKDFTKTVAANMGISYYQQYYVPCLKAFNAYLNGLTAYDTITLGVTQNISGISKTAKAIRNGETGIYRGKEHVKYLKDVFPDLPETTYSLYFVDIDYDDEMPTHFQMKSVEDVRSSLIKLIPSLQEVGMLIGPSSSANIYNSETGAKRSEYASWHIFFVVANDSEMNNKNFTEYIKRRAWRADVDLAYAKENGTGVVERYLIDLAVANPERIIVKAPPILEYPLKKEVVPNTLFEGGILDLASIDYESEPDYRSTYNEHKQRLLGTTDIIIKRRSPSSHTFMAPTHIDGVISISEVAKEHIIKVYNYLKATKIPKIKEVTSQLNDEIVAALLTFLGYSIDHNYKFKMRAEKTASASINYNGFIKDFGGDFSGNIINFIMQVYGLSFKESWRYIQCCFGRKLQLTALTKGALPYPKDFEKSLTIKNN